MRPDNLALSLLTAAAVRERANVILDAGLADRLEYFCVDLHRLEQAADFTVAITRKAYPSLEIPFHSRWRHFAIDGDDRWITVAGTAHWPCVAARARAEFRERWREGGDDAGMGSDRHD